MIGVICTCAPSFSKTLHEHGPSYEILISRLRSSFRSSSQTISKGSKNPSSGYQRRDSDQNSGDHISYKDRLTGGKVAGARGYELRNGSSFQTFVGGGPGGFAKEDGIHLKSEIVQERATGDDLHEGNKRKWVSTTAVREAEIV